MIMTYEPLLASSSLFATIIAKYIFLAFECAFYFDVVSFFYFAGIGWLASNKNSACLVNEISLIHDVKECH